LNEKNKTYELRFAVRDYECDLEGIVNNANYLHYLEHTRHEYLKAIGLDFAKMHDEGIDPVVTRIELDYKYPLKSGDKFVVSLDVERKGRLQIIFNQNIWRLPDERLILQGRVAAALLKQGRPCMPDEMIAAMEAYEGAARDSSDIES
jgi:acyl-CoA thioester hydrolase